MGRFVAGSVSASHICALCHTHSLAVTHRPSFSLAGGAQGWPQMLFRASLERHHPWGCSEPRLSEFSLGNDLLSGLAREGPSCKKWSLLPLVGQLREQSSAWQDSDALVCSAGFFQGIFPPLCVGGGNSEQGEGSSSPPFPTASICRASKASSRQPVLHRAGGDTWILPSSPWERA